MLAIQLFPELSLIAGTARSLKSEQTPRLNTHLQPQ